MTESQAIEHRHTIRLARWSAALGTLGLITAVFGIGVLLALVAIGCALVALNQLANLRAHDARGVALLGLVAGMLALLVFPLLLATAIPRFIAARQNSMHEHCYRNLIALNGSTSASDPELRCPVGGRYRNHASNAARRCSIPLHNERPGHAPPPQRLRFSDGGQRPFGGAVQDCALAPPLNVRSTVGHATQAQFDCPGLVGLHHSG